MKHRAFPTFSSLIFVAAFGVAACGSDAAERADTAEPGSEFCELSQTARDAGDAVDITSTDGDALKEQIETAFDASKEAAEAAPKDFEDLAEESIESQQAFIDILEDNDYDVIAASATDEGKELLGNPRYTEVQDERDAYLLEHCEIEPSTDDTQSDISFAGGDEGIRQLLTLLQLSPESELTDEQVECAVEALSGKISDEDVAAIANQDEVSQEGTAAFTDAVTSCGITLPQS